MMNIGAGSPWLSTRARSWAAGLGATVLLLCAAAPAAHAQTQADSYGQAIAPPPPLPPPMNQPQPRFDAQPSAPPSMLPPPMQALPVGMPQGATMCGDVHREMQQLLAALIDHRRTAETVAIRQRNRGLIAGGAALFTAAYLPALITGSFFLQDSLGSSFARDVETQRNASGTLLVPVIGPFVSSLIWREAVWSINWALVDGAAQVGGVVMMALGIYSNRKLPPPLVGLRVTPLRTNSVTGLTLSGAF